MLDDQVLGVLVQLYQQPPHQTLALILRLSPLLPVQMHPQPHQLGLAHQRLVPQHLLRSLEVRPLPPPMLLSASLLLLTTSPMLPPQF